jgi:hypothetical protein
LPTTGSGWGCGLEVEWFVVDLGLSEEFPADRLAEFITLGLGAGAATKLGVICELGVGMGVFCVG